VEIIGGSNRSKKGGSKGGRRRKEKGSTGEGDRALALAPKNFGLKGNAGGNPLGETDGQKEKKEDKNWGENKGVGIRAHNVGEGTRRTDRRQEKNEVLIS